MAKDLLDEFQKEADAPSVEEDLVSAFAQEPSVSDAPIEAPPEDPGLLQDIADISRGVAEGLTLGFSGELAAGIGATAEKAKDYLKGDSARSWLESYRARKAEEDLAEKKASERSPYLYGAGEVAGSLLPAVFTAGAGLAAGGAKAATKLGYKSLLKRLAVGGAKAVPAGAAMGAVQAAGKSEGELATEEGREQLFADIEKGAKIGGAISGGLGAVAAGAAPLAKKAAEKLEESPLAAQMSRAFKKGEAGEAIAPTVESGKKIARQQLEDIRSVTNMFLEAEGKLAKAIEERLVQASQEGVRLSPSDPSSIVQIAKALQQKQIPIAGASEREFTQLLYKYGRGTISPSEASRLRQLSIDVRDRIDSAGLRSIAHDLQMGIKETLEENVPGLKPLSDAFRDFRRAGSETVLAKGQPAELADVWLGDISKAEGKLAKEFTDLLSNLRMPGAREEEKRTFTQLLDNLTKFNEQHPDIAKMLNINPAELEKQLISKADEFAVTKQILGQDPQSSPTSLKALFLGPSKTGRGYALGAAQLAGKASGAIKTPVDISKRLYAATIDELAGIADEIGNTGIPGSETLAKMLRQSLIDKDVVGKNAALFSIIQNPQMRAYIQGRALAGEEAKEK